MNVTTQDREKIEQIISNAEKKTSSEFVVAIINDSDHYPAAHYRFAILLSFIITTTLYIWADFDLEYDPIILIWSMIISSICGYLLAYIPFIKKLFTTKDELNIETYQKAVELFHHHNVSNTQHRTGLLIFFSLLEKRVIILSDIGIAKKCNQEFWDKHIKELTNGIKNHTIVESIEKVIEQVSEQLSLNFPITKNDKNELPNQVITE